jgi:DHA2 family multidrug resistance protein
MFWMSTLTDQVSYAQLAAPRLWQGLGVPMFFLTLNQIVMSEIKPHEYASAAGLANFLRTIAGSITTATTVWLWNDRTDFHHTVLTEHIRPGSPGWQQTQQALGSLGVPDTGALAYAENVITRQAMTLGVNDVYMLFGCLLLCLIPILWFARPPFQASAGAGH